MPSTKDKITDGFNKSLTGVAAPTSVKEKLRDDFNTKQKQYSDVIVNAFASSIHKIFIVTSFIMVIALLFTFALKERVLHSARPTETPGEQ
jgi:hypothetical protein